MDYTADLLADDTDGKTAYIAAGGSGTLRLPADLRDCVTY